MHRRLLQSFVEVAECLHFVRAAQRLGIAQSTLSQQVADLETELGVQLLRRDNRNVSLTPAGEAFLPDARAMLAQQAAALARVRSIARGEQGCLRLGAASAAWPELVPRALEQLALRCPDLKVEVSEHSSSVQETMLLAGEIDAGLLHTPLVLEGLACEPLGVEPMVLALPEGHPLAELPTVPLERLDGARLLIHHRGAGPHLHACIEQLLAAAGAAVQLDPGPCALHTVLSLVRAQRGVAFVPGAAALLSWPGVALRPLRGEPLQLPVALAWRRGDARAPVQQLLQALRATRPAAPAVSPGR